VEEGEKQISEAQDYNSHNTTRLDIRGMQELLMKLDFIRAIVRGENAQPQD
jgi:UDP-glucose 4-epimerase